MDTQMFRVQSDAATIYVEECNREHAECAQELVQAFENNEKEVFLSDRAVHLNDVDVGCIAKALRFTRHSIRVLNMEGNAFGLPGLQALLEAIEKNPGIIRELRLGRNKLKDQAAVVVGHTLSRVGCGLRVLDLSENDITKLGLIPIVAALSDESCDIVELSLHNNKIEADAAVYLGQAIRNARKLRHLHLGYNSIRDTGAVQLAQCIPLTASLSTLDLTANRIGPEGGKEIARALMAASCNIQRLNLRHNPFDNETIEMYADVLQSNTSLIQLFLGFMNPTPDSAAVVLSSLRFNRTLLLLDIYGWKLRLEEVSGIIDNIQKTNVTIAAIVTDACQPIAKQIDQGNDERDERGQHPIYVGPDDHDAYVATKSLRRFSRAQSQRQSRTSSRAPVSSCGGSPSRRRANERSFSFKESETHSRYSRTPKETSYSVPRQMASDAEGGRSSHSRKGMSVQRDVQPTVVQRDAYSSLLDYQSGDAVRHMIEQLQRELDEQRRRQVELEGRVAALEKKRECRCDSNPTGAAEQVPLARVHTGRSGSTRSIYNRLTGNHNNQDQAHRRYSYDGHMNTGNGQKDEAFLRIDHLDKTQFMDQSRIREPFFQEVRRKGVTAAAAAAAGGGGDDDMSSAGLQQRSSDNVSGGPAEFPQISVARTERSEPPAEPLELPKEKRPVEALLQTSTKPADNYQPQLGPSPAKDNDPPRRKGSLQYA